MKRKRRARNTHPKSAELEVWIDSLRLVGFAVFDEKQFRKIPEADRPPRYLVRRYSHPTLYGTDGRKEGYLWDGKPWIVECKVQNSDGSTDEKLPFVFECFLASPVPNWIVIFEGKWCQSKRGRAAIPWLKEHAKKRLACAECCPGSRQFHVFTRDEARQFAHDQWGAK